MSNHFAYFPSLSMAPLTEDSAQGFFCFAKAVTTKTSPREEGSMDDMRASCIAFGYALGRTFRASHQVWTNERRLKPSLKCSYTAVQMYSSSSALACWNGYSETSAAETGLRCTVLSILDGLNKDGSKNFT